MKKSRIIEYYIRIAPLMLGFLKNRVIVMNRYPDGINKEGFYEKDAPVSTPLEWKELKKGLRPEEFNIFTVLKKKDPWEGLLESKQELEVE